MAATSFRTLLREEDIVSSLDFPKKDLVISHRQELVQSSALSNGKMLVYCGNHDEMYFVSFLRRVSFLLFKW